MQDKKVLRRAMSQQRDRLSAEELRERSHSACDRLLKLPEVQAASAFFCYVSYRSEVQTHALIQQWLLNAKTVAVPVYDADEQMMAQCIRQWADLQPGRFGILGPCEVGTPSDSHTVCVTPGLAFTERGHRLGYGRGNYDQYFQSRPKLFRIGLAFDFQIVDQLPTEPHDVTLDVIVTDERVIRCGET